MQTVEQSEKMKNIIQFCWQREDGNDDIQVLRLFERQAKQIQHYMQRQKQQQRAQKALEEQLK